MRNMDKTIVRAGPDEIHIFRRWRKRVNHASMLAFIFVRLHEHAEARRHTGIFTGQVWADDLPVNAAIHGLEHHIRSQIQGVRVNRRENEWSCSVEAISPGAQDDGRNILRLPCQTVEPGRLAAINNVGVERVWRNVPILFGSDGIPISKCDLAKIAAAGNSDASTFLLSTVDPVRKLVVGGHVIELRGWLVIPGAPSLAAVDANDDALIDR